MNDTTILEVSNLWKVFGDNKSISSLKNKYDTEKCVIAVQDISFELCRGELFVIMGLSGSGKSTLIRCLTRLIEPSSGSIHVNGRDVIQMKDEELIEFRRSDVAMVFQHYGLLPHRSVLDNVAFGLKLKGVKPGDREEKAREALKQVGLDGWEYRYPAHLSGGMRQRVGIARALVQDSELLLMDEPFSGLDPLIRRELQDELLRLQNELHRTIIFVTHDLSEAIRLGDRMAVMNKGIFVQIGHPTEIILNPCDEYVERFVSDERRVALMMNRNEGKVLSLMRNRDISRESNSETSNTAVKTLRR